MADDLQALLNKINEEGLKKAEQTKADIIAKAQAEAKGIIKMMGHGDGWRCI